MAQNKPILVVGTFDTKGPALRFLADKLRAEGLLVRTVDVSTSGAPSGADVPPHQVAAAHKLGAQAVLNADQGHSVAAMAEAFEAWIKAAPPCAGIISAGGSGGTALVAPAMQALAIGVPKLLVSTVASGNVEPYVGASDIIMMYSVTDVQGLNSISEQVLTNAANAVAGSVRFGENAVQIPTGRTPIGLTMFGVTTPAVQRITKRLEARFECLVFHATGTGGRSMEKLADEGLLEGAIDLTTSEVCDFLFGGELPCTEDRFGAFIRSRMPYVGAAGALDIINFGAPSSVPEAFRGRPTYEHNAQITIVRTTAEENREQGIWIANKLNQMEGPVRFFIPGGGLSALDAPGQPFWDPKANAALFEALRETFQPGPDRQMIFLPHHINSNEFADALADSFVEIYDQKS